MAQKGIARCVHLPSSSWTAQEANFFDVLKTVAPVWITGGWVRDRVLEHASTNTKAFNEWSRVRSLSGSPPGDIDVLVKNISAKEFRSRCKRHPALQALLSSPAHLVPAQGSRTIDTVKLRLSGQEIDVSSLTDSCRRYSANPLPPKSDDLLRIDCADRDTTFNALYYDLNSYEVVDPSGSGISDLDSGLVRMPHPDGPVPSVSTDPVRFLRCLRFASRYDFELDDSLSGSSEELAAAADFTKSSSGRLLNEVKKAMLLHNRPSRFLAHLGGPLKSHRHFFQNSGSSILNAWQSAVGRVRRMEEIVLEGVSRGRLTSRSAHWRGRRSGGPTPALLTADWRKTLVAENDWGELLLAALLWPCKEEAVKATCSDLQLSNAMADSILELQKQARQKLGGAHSSPLGVVLLDSAATNSGGASDLWDSLPAPVLGLGKEALEGGLEDGPSLRQRHYC